MSLANGRDELANGHDDDEPLFGPPRKRYRLGTQCDGRLYGILNVDPTASPEDIARAHRHLVATVHPDRAPPELREAAARQFDRVRQAYEVLSDPRRRAAYDAFGSSEEVDKLALVKYSNPEQFRAELREHAAEMERKELSELVGSSGEMLVSYDARVLVAPLAKMTTPDGQPVDSLSLRERFENVTRRQMFVKNGFKIPIDENTEANVTSQLLWRGRQVGGNTVVRLSHKRGPLSIEVGSALLGPYASNFKTKLSYSPNARSFYIVQVTPRSHLSPPPVEFTFGRQIGPAATGFATIKTGSYSLSWWPHQLQQREPPSFSMGINRGRGVSGRVDLVGSTATLNLERPITTMSGLSLTGSVTLGQGFGMNANLNASKDLTALTKFGCSLSFGLNGAVMLRLRLSRLGHRFFVPIVLGEAGEAVDFRLLATLIGVPSAAWTALHYAYLQPRKRRRVKSKLEDLRRQNSELIEERRKEAEEATALIRDSVQRRVEAEREKRDGLIFTSAIYGVFDSNNEPVKGKTVDVRIPIQSFVSDSMLFISGQSKAHLLGFYDPAIGEPKKLRLEYAFRGRQHVAMYDDMHAVTCPLSYHLIE